MLLQGSNLEEMSLKSERGRDQVQGKSVTSYDRKERDRLELLVFGHFGLTKMTISYIETNVSVKGASNRNQWEWDLTQS